jgi:transglutaminase-like putative cysteine protease
VTATLARKNGQGPGHVDGHDEQAVTEPQDHDRDRRSTRRSRVSPLEPITPLNLVATLALAATTAAAAASLWRVFPDWQFLPRVVAMAVGVHAVGLLCRWRRFGLLVSTLVCLAAIAIIITLIYYRGTGFGFLPTRSTWDTAWRDVADSWTQFGSAVAPVPSQGGYGVTATAAVGLIALLSDAFAFRAYGRVEAVVPSGLLFIAGAALGYDHRRLLATVLWLVPAVIAVALLRAVHNEGTRPWLGGSRNGRTLTIVGGSLAFAALIVPIAVAAGSHLPGARSDPLVDTRNRRSGLEVLSPLVDIQARLVNNGNTELFKVKASEPAYWRLTSLSDFDGTQWTSTADFRNAGPILQRGRALGRVVDQTFTIASLGNQWAPAAYSARRLDSQQPFLYDDDSGTLLFDGGNNLIRDMSYDVTSVESTLQANDLEGVSAASPPDSRYVELPLDFPDDLRKLAHEITADASTPYEQALALQNWFVDNFRYDVNVPWGNSDRSMIAFINAKVGFCQQFAGTYAALARAIGLPSRVAIGFTPGDVDGDGVYHVKGKHAHAWPEVWFDGVGWVLFEPTPGRGAPGAESYTGRQFAQSGGTFDGTSDQVDGGPTNGDAGVTSQSTVPGQAGGPSINTDEVPGGQLPAVPTADATAESGRNVPVTVFLVIVGVLLLAGAWMLLMPPIARRIHRSRHHRSPAEAVVDDWHQATAALGAVGAPRRAHETPSEHATRAWRIIGIDERALDELAAQATAAAYRPTVPQHLADRSAVLRSQIVKMLRGQMTWKTKLMAHLDPRLAVAFAR